MSTGRVTTYPLYIYVRLMLFVYKTHKNKSHYFQKILPLLRGRYVYPSYRAVG
jgi:hypothetical protein